MKRFHFTVWSSFFALIGFCVLIALGTWQVQRLQWKEALIDKMEQQMQADPVPLPETVVAPKGMEYRRVSVAGVFLHDKSFLVKPRTYKGKNGYHVMTPLRRVSGQIVFVNRGWISDDTMAQMTKPDGLVQVEGIIRLPETAAFTPENDPAKNDWYWADVKAMAKSAELSAMVMPLVLEASRKETGVYPIASKKHIDVPNNHFQYAVFWYAMAGILCVMFLLFSLKRQPSASAEPAQKDDLEDEEGKEEDEPERK